LYIYFLFVLFNISNTVTFYRHFTSKLLILSISYLLFIGMFIFLE